MGELLPMEDPVQQEVFQAKFIPIQTKRTEIEGGMKLFFTSYPPLGEVSVVKGSVGNLVTFTVLLEADESRASEPWEVLIWYSSENGDGWTETPLKPLEDANVSPISFRVSTSSKTSSLWFKGQIELKLKVAFTLKFRSGPDQPWKWVHDEQDSKDGVIISQTSILHSESEQLSDIIGDLNPVFQVSQVRSDTPDTSVWSVKTDAGAANGEESFFEDIKIGKPWSGSILRWFALIRIWTPWLAPRQGKSHFELDKEGILCSFMEPGGRHLVLLAISGVADVMTLFKTDGTGNLILTVGYHFQESKVWLT
jgi:hypothetical protein